MRSKSFVCAAIVVFGACTSFARPARAADGTSKTSRASRGDDRTDKKKANELHADDRSMKRQLQWEDKVLGPDSKRGELDKIARAQAINEKGARDREKQAALQETAPAPRAPVAAKKTEVAIPPTPEESRLSGSSKSRAHEISPKLATEAAQAPPPVPKPADDKFIDKLLKEEPTTPRTASAVNERGSRSERNESDKSDRELDALLAGAKAGRQNRPDSVDDVIKSADKGPAMPAPRSAAALPDWTNHPDIVSAPATPAVAAKPAARGEGVIQVLQVVQGATDAPESDGVSTSSRAPGRRNKSGAMGKTAGAKGQSTKAQATWNDPFADKQAVATGEREPLAPAAPAKKMAASRPSVSTGGSAWSDPFADVPEPRRTTRRAAPAPTPAPASGQRRGEKGDQPSHPANWKDPFTRAPGESTRSPVAMRELGKGESSKWEIAGHHAPIARAAAPNGQIGGWGALKKRAR